MSSFENHSVSSLMRVSAKVLGALRTKCRLGVNATILLSAKATDTKFRMCPEIIQDSEHYTNGHVFPCLFKEVRRDTMEVFTIEGKNWSKDVQKVKTNLLAFFNWPNLQPFWDFPGSGIFVVCQARITEEKQLKLFRKI